MGTGKFKLDRASLERVLKANQIKFDRAIKTSLEDTAYFMIDLIQHGGGNLPQRDTGYMQGSYSFHIGKNFTKEFSNGDRKAQALPPDLAGIRDNELRISFEAPYAAAQQKGYRIKNGKKIMLTPSKPGTGPGWLDKLDQKQDEILEFLEERLGDHLGL